MSIVAKSQPLWMRRLQIVFESKYNVMDTLSQSSPLTYKEYIDYLDKKYAPANGKLDFNAGGVKVVIGDNSNNDNYNIRVTGTKNLGLSLDAGVIQISNVSYETIALIMNLKLYKVTIKVGYKSSGTLFTIAKGEISYIQQKIRSRRDYELYITFASELVAGWSQNRINFSIRSGVNMYDMFNWMFMQQGLSTDRTQISPALKNIVLENMFVNSGTSVSIIEEAMNTYSNSTKGFILDADSSEGKVISISTLKDKKVLVINTNMINIANGNPTVTSDGLDISLFPVYNFMPGNILQIDNRIIDTSQGMTSQSGIQNNFNTNFLDPNGYYIITNIRYTFENRGDTFLFNCQAKALNTFKNLVGG